jgi:hypothetical protein
MNQLAIVINFHIGRRLRLARKKAQQHNHRQHHNQPDGQQIPPSEAQSVLHPEPSFSKKYYTFSIIIRIICPVVKGKSMAIKREFDIF